MDVVSGVTETAVVTVVTVDIHRVSPWCHKCTQADVGLMVWGATAGVVCFYTRDNLPTVQSAWYRANPLGDAWCISQVLYLLGPGLLLWLNREW